ncbi:hypothetical protein KI387_021013, partial [Taxus chinensis]
MAVGLVGALVGRLGGMVVDEISKEASLFLNCRKDFEWLKKKLVIVSTYLKDADVQSVHNKSVKGWLLDVADIAWDAEDIVEECAVESLYTNDGNTQSSCVVGCPFNYSQLFFRYKMARRIKDIRDRIRSVMEDAAELKLVADFTHSEQASTSTSQNVKWKRSSVLERDARPVAIKAKVEEILGLIDDPAAPVIAVVGMGGVGKTFLLQNVFNTIKDRRHSRLKNKRSLIVLDDVWRATGEDDLISTLGLPIGNNAQCKIVVTTRSRDVSRNMNAR